MSFSIPTEFAVDANVQQAEPFKVEVRIGQKLTMVLLAGLITAIVWKKVK